MEESHLNKSLFITIIGLFISIPLTEAYSQIKSELFFREDWRETPPATPITQEHVANQDLILNLYGTDTDNIRKSNHDKPADDPFYVWSGRSEENWAVTLKNNESQVDLTERASIKWRTKQSGMRCLYPILKLADGQWLIGDQCNGQSNDWRVTEFIIDDLKWRSLNIKQLIEGRLVEDPDLSRVTEVGFTDLMRGGGSRASSRLDWIEVYGKTVD